MTSPQTEARDRGKLKSQRCGGVPPPKESLGSFVSPVREYRAKNELGARFIAFHGVGLDAT